MGPLPAPSWKDRRFPITLSDWDGYLARAGGKSKHAREAGNVILGRCRAGPETSQGVARSGLHQLGKQVDAGVLEDRPSDDAEHAVEQLLCEHRGHEFGELDGLLERRFLVGEDHRCLLFTDTPFYWDKDRLLLEQYTTALRQVVQQILRDEEAILIAVYPVYHIE